MAGYSAYLAWAEEMGFVPAESPYMGLNVPAAAKTLAFIPFHKNALQHRTLAGRDRMLTHKQVAMHGLITRLAVSGEYVTMTAIAKEANVVPSTVSRFLDKLQVWNVFAIDITRGRHGGIRVRLRGLGDQLAAYAERAWLRVRKAAERALSRTKLNVASSNPLNVEEYDRADKSLLTTVVLMDATFSEAWDDAERRGAVLAGSVPSDAAVALPRSNGSSHSGVDPEAFRDAVYAERRRLAIIDPEGEAEAVRPLW